MTLSIEHGWYPAVVMMIWYVAPNSDFSVPACVILFGHLGRLKILLRIFSQLSTVLFFFFEFRFMSQLRHDLSTVPTMGPKRVSYL